jgi:hypothetical protein
MSFERLQHFDETTPIRRPAVRLRGHLTLNLLVVLAACASIGLVAVRSEPAATASSTTASSSAASTSSTTPNFTLTDANGTTYQRSGTLAPAKGPAPITLVVFADDASGAKQFAETTGLSPNDTVMLPDMPDNLRVTNDVYNAEPCPRVFVLDPSGKLVYTNNHKDDQPRPPHNGHDEMVIGSRVLTALRSVEPKS